ncbi:DUF1674 domain-containing protein [Sphingomonas changnyeongensis]|uniref:DUF1674 domain-containing protein n=1 Tax=Sphingomonas changnyeongensis TaxID=2698679 RepID=A0A7Z2S4L5_9SPHN|nr:DUF1674 domain-containing protein [Sphingomonas changnyeongensis]QHL90210.1 DUF1674 domain-containing protein [Sphingomonas changnyeongensis]
MGERPAHVKPPEYLSPSPPVPQPAPKAAPEAAQGEDDPLGLNPVRYGDWELKGIAIDF